ncbi:MAG: invasion associated locus B family protein [Pseudomonadota bacterium]
MAAGLAAAVWWPDPALAQTPDTLSETYSAWAINCQRPQDGPRRCVMSQTLRRQQGNERLLVTEFSINGDTITMAMLTPFGLDVSKGATLQTDDGDVVTVPFFTCLSNGCVVRQEVASTQIDGFRRGATLKVGFTVAQGGDPFDLESSLAGFSAAFKRLQELSAVPSE